MFYFFLDFVLWCYFDLDDFVFVGYVVVGKVGVVDCVFVVENVVFYYVYYSGVESGYLGLGKFV